VDRQKRSVFGVNKYTAALSQNEIKFYLKELSELTNKLSGSTRKSTSGKRGRKSSKKGGKKSKQSWNQGAPWRADQLIFNFYYDDLKCILMKWKLFFLSE
jgi:hypothetical protein